jgi:hypothetical protein
MGRALLFLAIIIGTGSVYFGKDEVKNSPLKKEIEQEITVENTTVDYGNYDPSLDERFSEKERNYFAKIVKSSEFEGSTDISRWRKDVKIFILGDKQPYLMNELKLVVDELNDIIEPINITIVNSRGEANLVGYFGSHIGYGELEPYAKKYLSNNWGLFVVNGSSEITSGTFFIDTKRCDDVVTQKHIVREELTQALGLFNDSYEYKNSIFYQGWSDVTEFAEIDKQLIRMLYNFW